MKMIRGAVLTREQVMDLLVQRGATREFTEVFKNGHKNSAIVICIYIHIEGLSYFMWQGLRPDNAEQTFVNEVTDPQICATLADHSLWEPSMINAIESGDSKFLLDYYI